MRISTLGLVTVPLAFLLSLPAPGLAGEKDASGTAPRGFTTLFNGKDLSGWHGMAHFDPRQLAAMDESERKKQITAWTEDARKHWTVEDGQLVNDGQGPFLTTDQEYADIELLIDYKTVPKADSGIYLRGTPQVQIWDSTHQPFHALGAHKGSGGLWNNSAGAPGKDPLVLADNPLGQWNHFRILQVGARTTVYLNDKLVVDHATMENFWDRALPLFPRGVIQLQTHGGEIRWRNIFLREIPAEEANSILKSHADRGFTSIFNGKTLEGWAGAVDNYEVKDGVIRCKPEHGGVLYHAKELSNFVARVEFKIPPGGNNGLAIRYPGKGDAAYAGMCELQILDDTAKQYSTIDPRQAHGSVYGMVPAKRGYLRPVGEWNYEEVTVKGPKIKVELNGTTIVDADLSRVHEFMASSPHPGKDRTSGYFGFAGHNDAVEFRDIAVKPLD
ncbi:MAG: DUF1080 domain-containing protein [Isosphaeraceae bacterium]